MRLSVPPFHVPGQDVAEHAGWAYGGETLTPLPPLIEAWDYQAELNLFGGLAVDIELLRSQSRADAETQFQVLVMAKSSSTKIERCVLRLDLPDLPQYDLPLDVTLDGHWLGGLLTLETSIVVSSIGNPTLGSARDTGSILWSVRHSTLLEGQDGLFPTDTEDFGETRPPYRDAPWVLSIDLSDFDALFAASVRLTLNTRIAEVASMLANPDSASSMKLAKILELDVTRQLALVAIGSQDILSRSIDPDSVALGDVLRVLVSRVWPSASTASLSAWRDDHPDRLELGLQQFVGVFR